MILEYLAPLHELLNLASIFDVELWTFMTIEGIGQYPNTFTKQPAADIDMDYAAYKSRVKDLWEDYKRNRFDPVTEEDFAILMNHLGDIVSVPCGDIFLYSSSCNKEIIAFQKAMKIVTSPLLLVTNADKLEDVMGQYSPILCIDEWNEVLLYRNLKYCPEDFFGGWKNMTFRSDLFAPELLFMGGTDGAHVNFMHIIRSSEASSCHIEIPAQRFSFDIPCSQMPNCDPLFYLYIACRTGSMPTLKQSMECVYDVAPSSCMEGYRRRHLRYYDPQRQRLVDIHIPGNVGKEWDIQAVNAEISRYMCILDRSCYILDGNSMVAYYGREVGPDRKIIPLCLDEFYYQDDICVLVPHKDEKIVSDPRFMNEINRVAKRVSLALRKNMGRRLTTKEIAFCVSCVHLNDAETLKARVELCLQKHQKEVSDIVLGQIVSDIMSMKNEEPRYFNDEYLMYDKDANGNYGLLMSRKGKRRADDPMSRPKFLEVYWKYAKDWGLGKNSKYRGMENTIIDWSLFGDMFGVDKLQLDNWRRAWDEAKNFSSEIKS